MSFLMGKQQQPKMPPPVPQIDDAVKRRNEQDRGYLRRGRGQGTTIFTSDNGLPDLGTTTTASAGGF